MRRICIGTGITVAKIPSEGASILRIIHEYYFRPILWIDFVLKRGYRGTWIFFILFPASCHYKSSQQGESKWV